MVIIHNTCTISYTATGISLDRFDMISQRKYPGHCLCGGGLGLLMLGFTSVRKRLNFAKNLQKLSISLFFGPK